MAVKKSPSEKSNNRKKVSVDNGGKPALVEQNGASQAATQAKRQVAGLENEIRRRAYEIYEARGRQHGLDRDDWIQAEAEVRERYKQSA